MNRIRMETRLAHRFALLTVLLLAACGSGAEVSDGAEEPEEEEEEGVTEVHLDADALAMSDIELGVAGTISRRVLSVTGSVTYDQNRVSHIGPKTQGRVVELRAEVGSRVRRGQVLAALESPDVGTTRAELHEAEALLGIAQENYEREQRLEAQGISSRSELLMAEAELRRIQAQLRSAVERLRVLGAGDHGEGGHFDVTAPFNGVVVERHAALGEVAGPTDRLMTVADLSKLWIELDIFERDLSKVSQGQMVAVATAAWPDREFPGRIVYVGDILDTERRTIRARVEVDNEDRALKPGMFATAMIDFGTGEAVVALPRDAVQTVEDETVVWIPGDEDGAFITQAVALGDELPGGFVEILVGLNAGDAVVLQGAFTLKAELGRGELAGHGH